ncbi:Na/Pi symporter [Mesobacillus selenatarsenatis]|uniref:Sodium-dependent phosphate transporter n=1 Tax=Mesobacillus selenatarsenatis (strain DSM 18680 / JCM 14380 / FERM P-15431 / SF-1) TaxID=1321606 RepID=A0A0A8XAM3_MESS1|nr:Na/Pi symporter [Mesobacillus selenatarsenatis]GAM15226.1 sodium-dependent phosphate transporter [Mesobacillus selenatarsenatis SF-1]
MVYLLFFLLFLAVFIGGMTLLRKGLFELSASRMKNWLAVMTDTPLKGLIAGAVVTALLHSSSAVMVITIGLISAGLLKFSQSIGIILGSNIGTTFTLEIITFNIDAFIVPFAIIGAILMVSRNRTWQNIGAISFGMAAVFAAMRGFTFLADPVTSLPIVELALTNLNNSHLISIFTGTVVTAMIQSSTAMTGIIMGFLSEGTLSMDSAIAAMLGANIGTCITAMLASIGAGKGARLTAFAHVWLNIAGAAVFYPFIEHIAALAPMTAARPEVQLAHVSVVYNIIASLLVLPMSEKFGRMIEFIHGKEEHS